MNFLLRVSKRRGKEEDKSSKRKKSEYREKVSSEVLHVGSKKVSILSNVGNSEVRSFKHHLRSLGASLESIAGY